MTLDEIRKTIDQLDQQITALLVQRMAVTKDVAAYKKEHGLPIFVPEREQAVLEKVSALSGEEYAPYIRAIYQSMMDESKKHQEKFLEEE